MSLPDAPNTLREKYYSVMAGQNDADILPDIETAPSTENRYLDYIARNGGGGGGDDEVWLGTRAEHTAAETAGTLPETAIIGITDESGSGGSTVEVTQIKTSGEKIATITVDNVPTDIYANVVIDTSCTLTAVGWTGSAAPYTQTVNVSGILSTDKAMCDLSVSSTISTGLEEIDDWALISKIESGTGTLTFSCYEDKPTVALTVNVKVVR